MGARVPTRLTAAAGRRFGLTVGAAFVIIAAVLRVWRGAVTVPLVFGGIGALLLAAAVVAPRQLGPLERVWMRLAHLISRVTTPIFLGVVYFVAITPTGIIRRLLGKNALVRSEASGNLAPGSFWIVRAPDRTQSDLDRQF